MTSPSPRTALWLSIVVGSSLGCAPAQQHAESGATPTLTSEDFKTTAGEPIEVTLSKKVPGLRAVRTSDGGIALQIRGSSSFNNGDTPPLFILNGNPFKPGPGGALTDINPEDIDTVKVLRGAEAGLYGIDGANGVILITTKMAGKIKR